MPEIIAVANPYDCVDDAPYIDANCDTAVDEGGRVQHMILVEESVMPADPLALTSTFILTQVVAGKAHVVRYTQGTYDGGRPVEATGFGNQQSRVVGKDHTLVFRDLNGLINGDFYDALESRAALYRPIWLSESRLWVPPTPVGMKAVVANPTPENTTDSVVYETTITWSKKRLVRTYWGFDIAGLLSGTPTTGPGGTANLPAQNPA